MVSRPPAEPRPAPRLALLTPWIEDAQAFAELLRIAVTAADVAAVVLRLKQADERTLVTRIKALAAIVQEAGAALILYDLPDLVGKSGADGAHCVGIGALEDNIGNLQPKHIAGVGALKTRHDAMLAGEAGADYVMFGEPYPDGVDPASETTLERVSWWAEVFQVQCVGVAAAPEYVAPIAQAGADFVALGEWAFAVPADTARLVADAAAAIGAVELAP
jgi:thiamine-phosphate pyrophosphorylase